MLVGYTLAPLTPVATGAAGRSVGPWQIAGGALLVEVTGGSVAPQPLALLVRGTVAKVIAETQLALGVQGVNLSRQTLGAVGNVGTHGGLQTGLVGFPKLNGKWDNWNHNWQLDWRKTYSRNSETKWREHLDHDHGCMWMPITLDMMWSTLLLFCLVT